nr:hypothetical protein Iba_chr13aCG9450 [Ipomoea batatas]
MRRSVFSYHSLSPLMITVVAETSEMRSGALALTRMITDLGLEVAVDDGVGGLHVLRQGSDGIDAMLYVHFTVHARVFLLENRSLSPFRPFSFLPRSNTAAKAP